MRFSSIKQRRRQRQKNHFWIIFTSFALTAVWYPILFSIYPQADRWIFRWSLSTGYTAILLLALTLSLGSWNLWNRQVNPVSSDLRRDIGIWCGIFSIIHVICGLNVHMKSWTLYFVTEIRNLRTDLFGLTNYLGAVATFLVLVLLATSNDFSLRRLGRTLWKQVQRLNYLFALFIFSHAFLYLMVEDRIIPFSFFLGIILLSIIIMQLAGLLKVVAKNK